MIYVLDTDILSLLAHKNSSLAPRIRQRIVELPPENLVTTTIINYEEQMRGWMAVLSRAKSPVLQVEVYARLLQHLTTYRQMDVLGYDQASVAIFEHLKNQRLRIGAMDLKIAAIALAHDATLVTRNLSDFRTIRELRIEDWSAENNT